VAVSPTAITNNSSTRNYTIAGPGQISGNVSLVKQGSSTLTLSGANGGFTGTAAVQSGTLRVGNNNAFGAGTVVVTNAGTLDLNGAGLGEVPVIVAGAGVGGNGAIVNSGVDQIHAVNIVKLSGDAVFGGTGRWDIRVNGLDNAALTTSDGNTHNLVKTGSNLVALVTCAIDQSIGDIDVQGGNFALQLVGTAQNSTAWFGDTTHTISVESNATFEVNSLTAAYPLSRTLALNDGSTLLSDAGSSAIGGSVLLTGNANISVTAGTYLEMDGVISGSGNLLKTGGLPLTLTATNTYTGSTLVIGGALRLWPNAMTASEGLLSGSTNIVVAAGATLDVSAKSDPTLTLASAQLLQGDGTLAGNLVVGPGATVSAGTNSVSTGTLIVTGAASLDGAAWMKIDPSAGTNDVLAAASITNGGTLSLNSVSGPFHAGQSFQLFNASSYTGAFSALQPATPGAGLGWNTNSLAVNGVLSVVSVVVPQPVITSVGLAGGNLVFSGTNGNPGGNYYLLESTNLTLPRANWTVAATNQFSLTGTFSLTNSLDPAKPALFYLLAVPTP